MTELQEKIARLPAWARDHIRRLEVAAEPNNAELRFMRQQVENIKEKCRKMQDRMNIMEELFHAAGRGGHEVAQAYVERVIADNSVDG